MKSKNKQPQKENIRFNANKAPGIRDNPDSRKQEEQDFKGDDIHTIKNNIITSQRKKMTASKI